MLSALKQRVGGGLAVALEGLGFAGSLAGASLSLLLGKLFASALFVLLAVGILNRFVRRRRGELAGEQRAPVWVLVVCLLLSIIEAGVVVEAMNLPVRFDQPGFEKSNLLLVAAMLLVFFYGQRYLFMRVLAARRSADAL
jgi:hypothetical protein